MDFVIRISTDNDAFGGRACGREVARILRDIAKHVAGSNRADFSRPYGFKIRDINGNAVGSCEVEK